MRLLATSLTLLVLAAPGALAQEPDTTDAWRYLPFHLGDVWEYARWADVCDPPDPPDPTYCDPEPNGFLRREVVRDTTLASEPAWIVRESRFNNSGLLQGEFDRIVRYDTTEARAYEYRMDGSLWGTWPDGFPCTLDAAPGIDEACDYIAEVGLTTWTGFGSPVPMKWFVTLVGSYDFAADIGLVSTSGGDFVMAGKDIVYARVDGEEYGTRFPVASESTPEAVAFGLAAHPNPLRAEGTLTLRLERSERVVIETFDVLGRRVALVHDGVLPAGEHRLALDASGLGPGLYVVRAAGGSARVATRVTVVP